MESRFDHVVVLMLENRSFDHLLGYLGKGDGLTDGERTNYLTPCDPTSPAFSTRKGGDFVAVGQGPSHSTKQTNEQLFGKTAVGKNVDPASATLDGFVASFATSLKYDLKREPTDSELQQVMNCFDPIQLPVLSTLAREFILCDRWFADVPGPTMPNRAFVHAATSQGYTYNANWKPHFECDTIYDRINAKDGSSWRVYYHDNNDVVELYPKVQRTAANNVLFEENFLSDVAGDKLATYSFITPAFMGTPEHPTNSMHAPADVRPAEKLVADVYTAFKSHEDVWKKTLLIVVFDEHGGYYDHVQPPRAVSPDGIDGRMDEPYLVPFGFDRYGLRVPCILVSPWFPPAVDSRVYSHATIPGSVIEAYCLGKFLTERDAQSNKLSRYFDQATPAVWRDKTPEVEVPVQPQGLDAMQREMLDGSVHLDPHPENRNNLRTRDIVDPQQAKQFVRIQVAKHLEHYLAAGGDAKKSAALSADIQSPSTSVSASRIAELKASSGKTGVARPRP